MDKLSPLYLLHGNEGYLEEKAIDTFLSLIGEEFRDFNVSMYEDSSYEDAINTANSFPMFGENRLVVLKLSKSEDKQIVEALDKYLKSPLESTIFVVSAVELTKFTLTSKNYCRIECNFESDSDLYKEMQVIAAQPPKRILDSQACIELAKRTQKNMHRIVGEILKLKSYKEDAITKQDVLDMVSADLEFRTYELTQAVNNKDMNEALKILKILEKEGASSITLLGDLYNKYKMMLHIELNRDKSNSELGEMLGVKDGQIYYARQISQKYTQMKLKNCVDYLHNLQIDIVTGRIEESAAIHQALIQMISL